MKLSGFVEALLPVFNVLALGYAAVTRYAFEADLEQRKRRTIRIHKGVRLWPR
jgi:hypothetical protein